MKLISKKALTFKYDGQSFSVKPLEMVEAPEWIVKDPLFGWAKTDGTISTTGKDSDLEKTEPEEPKTTTKKR